MDAESRLDFERKARFDLWLHQNELFWGRFQLLALIQASFFAIVLAVKPSVPLMISAFIGNGILMAWLYGTLETDRTLRNFHAGQLRDQFKFDPLPPQQTLSPWLKKLGLTPNALEILFQASVFLLFLVADVVVLWRSLTENPLGVIDY